MRKPVMGITMGDPVGIGLEIVLKALVADKTYDICVPVVIGSADVLNRIEQVIKTGLKLNKVNNVADAKCIFGTVDIDAIATTPI